MSATNIINITIENHNYDGEPKTFRNIKRVSKSAKSSVIINESHRSVPSEKPEVGPTQFQPQTESGQIDLNHNKQEKSKLEM